MPQLDVAQNIYLGNHKALSLSNRTRSRNAARRILDSLAPGLKETAKVATLGTVVGDYALAQGASAVVLAGGLGLKLRDILPASDFGERFRAKPRYEQMMAGIPVKLIVHPQPGLYGAAAAFALEHLG